MVREVGGRLALVVVGVVVGLVLLEAALQASAAYTAMTGRRDVTAVLAGRRRILTLGDSNTYGLYVPLRAAYPRVLERLWNRRHRDQPIEVANFAYPGMNSSRVRNLFPRIVRTVRPDLVLLMIGANDVWTVPEPIADAGGRPSARQLLWRHSRVYRLLYMIGRALRPPRLAVRGEGDQLRWGRAELQYGNETFDFGYRGMTGSEDALRSDLIENLVAIVAQARREGVELALLTYPDPTGFYAAVSGMIRDAARRSGAHVIEVSHALADPCAAGACAELFPDGHPTVAGHRRVAKRLVHELTRLETRTREDRRAVRRPAAARAARRARTASCRSSGG